MTMNRDSVLQQLQGYEQQLLQPGGPSGFYWNGVGVNWIADSKKNGSLLKRGKTYGRIAYTDRHGKEIPRETAIEECLKPFYLRQAEIDIETMLVCSICGAVGIGLDFDKRHRWLRHWISWARYENREDEVWISICPECLKVIAAGGIKRATT